MSYDNNYDTVTSANSNRAASHKFYTFFAAPSRSYLPQDLAPMLHRSPSGAKRKIKKRREEAARPPPFLSPSSSSSQTSISPSPNDTSSTSSSHYRNLIDSGDYQSILPEFDTNFHPIPTPRLSVPFSTSMSSLELTSTTISSLPSTTTPTKPTIEVHPMPSEERVSISSSLNGSIDLDVYKTRITPSSKPAVPAKPKGLLIDHLNRSTSMTSLSSPIQHTTSAFLNTFMPTASFINLQQEYRNPDLGSQDLAQLESNRHESIRKVSRKLSTYEEEKNMIGSELDEIERIGARLLSIVEQQDANLAAKLRRHHEKSTELIQIETNLRLQMKKIEDRAREGVIDKSSAHAEESRLRRRFQETDFLRSIYIRRENDHDRDLANIFSSDEMIRWKQFKEACVKLQKDDNTVDYCIRESKMKLDALHLAPRS